MISIGNSAYRTMTLDQCEYHLLASRHISNIGPYNGIGIIGLCSRFIGLGVALEDGGWILSKSFSEVFQ